MFWISIGFLTLAVVATALHPLMRRRARATGPVSHSVGIYREQLAGLDRDIAGGLLTEEQAGAARLEIERRILAATKEEEASPPVGVGAVGRRLTIAAIAVGLPAGALSLYLFLGMPNQADRPLAQRTEELKIAAYAQKLDELSKTLAAGLEVRPDDAKGWAMLGRLYQALGRFVESADAYGQVHRLKPGEVAAAVDHGEALVQATDGFVTEAAETMFVAAVEADPEHVKARYYLGSALAQRPGGLSKAIEVWSSLERDSPPDAPWLDAVRQNIRLAEAELANAAAKQ